MGPHASLLRLAVLLVALCPLLRGQDAGPDRVPPASAAEALSPERRAELQRRWQALDPEERARLRQRVDELRALPDEEREALRRRAHGLGRLERRIERSLTPEQRERLARLDPERRAALMRELLGDEVTARGQRLLEKLPDDVRRDLEATDRRGRWRAVERLRERQTRALPDVAERLADELGLDPQGVARLRGLDPDEARRRLAEVARRRITQQVQRQGLPSGLPPQVWQRLEALDDEEFLAGVLRLRERHPEWAALQPGRRGRWGGATEREDAAPRRGPRGPGAAAGPGSGAGAGASGGRAPLTERRRQGALRRALWVGAEARLELAELPPRQRRERLDALRRAQVLATLERDGWVDAARLEELRALDPDALAAEVRRLLGGR